MTNVSVLVNQLASLYCEVEGTPSPVISWYKDDIQVNGDGRVQYAQSPASVPEIECADVNFFSVVFFPNGGVLVALEITIVCLMQVTESSTVQIVNNGKTLKLFKVSAEDTGKYSCKALNIAGTAQKYFSVNVLGKENL